MGSGDPMLQSKVRMVAMTTTAFSVLVLAGCGVRQPVDAGPPVSEPGYGAAQTPDLMGAPPAAEPKDGLLGGPVQAEPVEAPASRPLPTTLNPKLKTWRRADGTLVTAMAPIPNPKEKRRAVRYAPRAASGAAQRKHVAPPAAKPVVAAKPVAKPTAKPPVIAAAKPAPVVKSPVAPAAAAPQVVKPAPAPLKPVVAATPVAPLAKAPTPVVAPPAKALTKVEQLQAAIAPEATKGAVLATGESLSTGKEGQVTLSLPASLGDMIKTQAAKLGLVKPAKKASAYANLEGQGYEITPNGKQTAVIKPGESATFAWQVKPTADAKGQLKSEFGVELNGTKPAQTFSLGTIAKQVAPIQEKVKDAAKGFKLPFALPNLGGFDDVDVPMVGKVPAKSVLGGALVLLALLILVIISRSASASKAREERRRKFRTLTDYGRNEMEFGDDAPKTAHVGYVNPMVAAAGGALAGAAVATAVSHAHDDHGHDDHHAAPGHDDHAAEPGHHDDHGHGHDHHHDDHHAPAAAHDDHHGHPVAAAAMTSPVATPVSHEHDDHGHHGDDHAHDAHGHEGPHAEAGHDDHGHDAHDDHHAPHAHGHDDHHGHHVTAPAGASPEVLTVSHDEPAAHHDAHGHDDHGAHDGHEHKADAHDDHHPAAHDDHHDHHGHPVAAKELAPAH
jgi:hypothetical protein